MKILFNTLLISSALAGANMAQASVVDNWSDWFSQDRPGGSGDYELLKNLQREMPERICENPSLIQARLVDDKNAAPFTPQNIPKSLKLRVFSATEGLVCANKDQPTGRCADFSVRFLCAPATAGQLKLPIESADIFLLKEPMPQGNALAVVELDRQQKHDLPREFSILNDNTVTVVNDIGKGADAKPGDGVFTGFMHADVATIDKTREAIHARFDLALRHHKSAFNVRQFNGRSVSGETDIKTSIAIQRENLARMPRTIGKFEVIPIAPPHPTHTPPSLVAPENALVINSPSVVANPSATFDPCNTDGTGNHINPDATYSFKTLISNLNDENSSGITDQQFVHNWLDHWLGISMVNNFAIPARPDIVDYFPGWDGANASTLDLDRLPFRLLAIVNRIDLGNIPAYGNSSANKPGEIRFVFGLLKMDHTTGACLGSGVASGIDQMTAIFEYGDATHSCSSSKALANDWLALDADVINGSAPLGSPAYMADLKTITDTVTAQGADQLNQLRTNDFAFDGLSSLAGDWQLREFVMDDVGPNLIPTTIKQTPQFSEYRDAPAPNSTILADYVVSAATEPGAELLCDAHSVPLQWEDPANPGTFVDFLGSHTDYAPTTSWPVDFSGVTLPASMPSCYAPSYVAGTETGLSAPVIMQIEMRHKLSLNACDDCHADETDTTFTHISPVTRGLSGFMTGTTVLDPTPSPIEREFNDIARRNQALSSIAGAFCGIGPGVIGTFAAEQAALKHVH
ncbi:MAG TPA: hypothetical protein VIC26_11135 [Marinagarivorans sp.]